MTNRFQKFEFYCCVFKYFHSGKRFNACVFVASFSSFPYGRDLETQQNVCVFKLKTPPCGCSATSHGARNDNSRFGCELLDLCLSINYRGTFRIGSSNENTSLSQI